MITRIVQLPIDPRSNEEVFIRLFDKYKAEIAGAEGCLGVKMLRDDQFFFTYSRWESEGHLNAYRHSKVFEECGHRQKPYFRASQRLGLAKNYLISNHDSTTQERTQRILLGYSRVFDYWDLLVNQRVTPLDCLMVLSIFYQAAMPH